MHRHPYFNLWMHDDDELAAHLRSDLRLRITLHQWPLSCVQRLDTVDGRQFIYKTQYGPTVEPEFYARARSPLLVWGETIFRAGRHVAMLLEHVQGPLLGDLTVEEYEVVRIGREITEQMKTLDRSLACYVDISNPGRWERLVECTLSDISTLIEQGKFCLVDRPSLHSLSRFAAGSDVAAAIRTPPRYFHGDLAGDNLFVLPGGYRVIDWQYPKIGPPELDLATLLASMGYDPLPYVGPGIVRVMHILRIHWLAECATRWFPAGVADYDRIIPGLINAIANPAKSRGPPL